jgi:5-methylcytosine-specific restriction endonuclease McrA
MLDDNMTFALKDAPPSSSLQKGSPLSGFPALVLNADYRPLSYYPLSVWSWQDAIKAVYMERVEVIAQYDQAVHSPSCEMRLPSVISLKEYVHQDGFTCAYCGSKEDLTFDHVVPRSRGGKTTWENIVTACSPCNLKKGGRSLKEAHMNPKRMPRRPSMHELQAMGRKFPPHHLHESWLDWLYWDVVLDA